MPDCIDCLWHDQCEEKGGCEHYSPFVDEDVLLEEEDDEQEDEWWMLDQ